MKEKSGRVYVCHTYYHAYISVLKELYLDKEIREREPATLILSKLSNRFEDLKQRMDAVGFFEEVIEFDEKDEAFFPELAKYRVNRGGIRNLIQRVIFTRKFADCQEAFIPVDFKTYRDIYVFCDSDPIGTYLNMRHIRYHAVEDGLNCIVNLDMARYTERQHFKLKYMMSKFNFIFIQNGYSKYCIDMEVNDIKSIKHYCKKFIELPRERLVARLTDDEKQMILSMFVRDMEGINRHMQATALGREKILILTEPLCSLAVRKQIFTDLIATYEAEGDVYLKPHPRDELDYFALFPTYPIFDGTVPMEMLNFIPGIHFNKVISVLTEVKAIQFADECIRLGSDFMDRYEEPSIHRQNEEI